MEDWVLIVFVVLLVMGIACCCVAARAAYQAWTTRDLGSEKFVELTNLDEITKQLETWRDSHSMLFVLDGNLQMLVWSEGMIRVGSVWSCSQKIGAVLSFSPRITHDQQLLSAYRFSCYPIHVCTHDPHDVLHRQVVLALEKRYFSC